MGKAKYLLLKVVHSLHMHNDMFLIYSLLLPALVIYGLHAPCYLFMPFGLEAKMVRKSRPPNTKSKINKKKTKAKCRVLASKC